MDEQEIKKIKVRLDELEKLATSLNGKGMAYYVNIEHAEFQGPIVDKLDYNFDKLDVKEVSGALNLGNNFGVRVGKVTKKEGEGTSSEVKSQSKMTSFQKKTTSGKAKAGGTSQKEASKTASEQKEGQKKGPSSTQTGSKKEGPSASTQESPKKESSASSNEFINTSWADVEKPGPHTSSGHMGTASAGGASGVGAHVAQVGGRELTKETERTIPEEAVIADTRPYSQSPLHLGRKAPEGITKSTQASTGLQSRTQTDPTQEMMTPGEATNPVTYDSSQHSISLKDQKLNQQLPQKEARPTSGPIGRAQDMSIGKRPQSIQGKELDKGLYRTKTGFSFKKSD